MGNAKEPHQLAFEVEKRARARRLGVEMIESAGQQVEQRGVGVLRFDHAFHQLAAIRGEEGGGVLPAEPLAPVGDGDFAQRMEVALTGADEMQFTAEKQVELPGERASRAARTFCGRFHQAVIFRQPVDDQAGIGEPGQPGDDGAGGLHGGEYRGWRDFVRCESAGVDAKGAKRNAGRA